MTFKKFFVAGIPKSKGNHSVSTAGKIYDNTKGLRKWEDNIAWVARGVADSEPSRHPIDLNLNFIMNGETPGVMIEIREIGLTELEYFTTRPDIDKLSRSVLDALKKGGIYKDDSQVCRLEAQKLKNFMGDENV